MIFLDSDAIITFLRGRPEMAAFLAAHKDELFAIASPSLFEIYYGFYYPPLSSRFSADLPFLERLKQEKKRLLQLLNDINIFDLTNDSIETSAKISATLDSQGKHIGEFDSLIAGIILTNGYTSIVSNNSKHFEQIEGLKVLNY